MFNKESLIEIMQQLKKHGISELIVSHDRVEIRTYERGGARSSGMEPGAPPVAASAPPPAVERKADEISQPVAGGEESGGEMIEIKAPLPGAVFVSPGTDENGNPLPKEGDPVDEETIIALVEAMKMFNKIFSPVKGVIKSIKAKNETNVKAGDLLMLIEKKN